MATEKRLIDANVLEVKMGSLCDEFGTDHLFIDAIVYEIGNAPTVDAVEVPDKDLLRAIKLLIKQYEHSKNSEYVHSPVAHALYHTWKQAEERRTDHV